MKNIFYITAFIIVASTSVTYAGGYTVHLTSEQEEVLGYKAKQFKMLPDAFMQKLITDYCNGQIETLAEEGFRELSRAEKISLSRKRMSSKILEKPKGVKTK